MNKSEFLKNIFSFSCIIRFFFLSLLKKIKNKMIVRYEEIRNSDEVLVISETGKYLGKMLMVDFVDCIDFDKNFEEDDYLYFFADKKELERRTYL